MTANQFKKFLSVHGWTGYEFSKLTGLPKSTVYQWLDTGVNRGADKLLIEYINQYPDFLHAL